MAQLVPAGYLDAIAQSHGVRSRVAVLDDSRNELLELSGADGYVVDGTVTMSRSQNPARTATLTIANPGGVWTPRSLASELSIGRYVTIQRGVAGASGATLFQVLLGVITEPQLQVGYSDDVLTITIVDLWRTLQKKRFQTVSLAQAGQRVSSRIRELAVLGGWTDDASQFDLDDGGAVFSADTPAERYSLIADEMETIAADYALWLRVAWNGVLTLSAAPSVDSQGDPVRSYQPGEVSTLVEITKRLTDAGFYNHVLVTGQTAASTVVSGEWRDLNPLSASYNPPAGFDPAWRSGGGPMGDLMMEPWSSAGITAASQASAKARQLGFEVATQQESHDWSIVGDPSIEPGDVVSLDVVEADVSGSMVVNEMSMGLSEGAGDDLLRIATSRQRRLVP